MSWVSHFGLKGDPFGYEALDKPDEFGRLFVKTKQIEFEVDPIVAHLAGSTATTYLIAGQWGIGKTTVLNYVHNHLPMENTISSRITLDTAVRSLTDPIQGLGRNLLHGMISGILDSIVMNFAYLRESHLKVLKEISDVIGYDIENGIDMHTKEPPYGLLQAQFVKLCGILERERVNGLVEIDNLDRLTSLGSKGESLALTFLRDGPAQEIFGMLHRSGITVILTVNAEWLLQISKDPKFNFLGNIVELSPLNPPQARELIVKRMAAFFVEPSRNAFDLFEKSALRIISEGGRGIPRDILLLTRATLVEAFKRSSNVVTTDIVSSIASDERTRIGFHEIVYTNALAQRGNSLLDELYESLDFARFKTNLQGLYDIYRQRRVEQNSIEEARYKGCVSIELETGQEPRFVLSAPVKTLFFELDRTGQLQKYIDWFKQPSKVSLTVDIPQSVKDQQSRVKESFRNLEESVAREDIKRYFQNSHNAFDALLLNIEGENFDGRRVSGLMLSALRELARGAFVLEAHVSNKSKTGPTPDEGKLEEFLLAKLPGGVALYGEVTKYCDLVSRGASFDGDRLRRYSTEMLSLLIEIMNYCGKEIQEIKQQLAKNPQRTSELGEIATRIGRLVKPYNMTHKESYFVAYLQGQPLSRFLLLGWPGSNKGIFVHVYGDRQLMDITGIATYKVDQTKVFVPTYVHSVSRSVKAVYLFTLDLYNERELAQCLALYATASWIICEFVQRDTTTRLRLSHGRAFEFVVENFLPSQFGKDLAEPTPIIQMKPHARRASEAELLVEIRDRENELVERKSSFRFDTKSQTEMKSLEKNVSKTVAAFANSHGGRLYIGIDDDCNILGLEPDYSLCRRRDSDGFERELRQSLEKYLEDKLAQELVSVSFPTLEGKEICRVDIGPSTSKPIVFHDEGKDIFFVRQGNSSAPYSAREFFEYWERRKTGILKKS